MAQDLSHAEIKVKPGDLAEPTLEEMAASGKAFPNAAFGEGGAIYTRAPDGTYTAIPAPIPAPSGEVAANLPRNAAAENSDPNSGFFDRLLSGDISGAASYAGGSGRREFNVPEFNPSVGGQVLTSLAFGDEGKAGIIAKMYQADQPQFVQDKFGNVMVTFGAGERKGQTFYVNDPGFSMQDATTLGTNLAMTAIPGGLAGRAAVNAGVRGALAVGASEATGALAGETARQVLGNAVGDETRRNNLIPGIDLVDMATASIPQGVGAGASFNATNLARPSGAPANIDQIIRDNAAAFDRTGVPGLRGQIAGTGAELERTRVLQNLEETSAGMKTALEGQNKAVTTATTGLVNDVAPASGVLAETQAKSAAESAIKSAKKVRADKVGPLYDAALDTGSKIDTAALVREIDAVASAKGAVPGTTFGDKVTKVKDILKAGDDWQLDPRQVQSVKVEVADLRKAALREGKDGLASKLADVEDQIVLYLDTEAPGYKQANELWAKMSQPVKDLQDSAIGELANLDRFGLQQFSRRLFSGSTSPAEREFVKANLDKADPMAYRRLVQSEMGRRLDDISDIGTDTGIENTPRLINAALFRNENTRQMWKQALPDMADRLDDLHYVLNLATTGRNAGSATATRKNVVESLTSLFERGGTGLRTTLLNWTVGLPITTAEKGLGVIGTARTQKIRAGALADQTAPDVTKLVGDYAERVGKTNPRLAAILQSVRQYAMTDGASQPPADDPMASVPLLKE